MSLCWNSFSPPSEQQSEHVHALRKRALHNSKVKWDSATVVLPSFAKLQMFVEGEKKAKAKAVAFLKRRPESTTCPMEFLLWKRKQCPTDLTKPFTCKRNLRNFPFRRSPWVTHSGNWCIVCMLKYVRNDQRAEKSNLAANNDMVSRSPDMSQLDLHWKTLQPFPDGTFLYSFPSLARLCVLGVPFDSSPRVP